MYIYVIKLVSDQCADKLRREKERRKIHVKKEEEEEEHQIWTIEKKVSFIFDEITLRWTNAMHCFHNRLALMNR